MRSLLAMLLLYSIPVWAGCPAYPTSDPITGKRTYVYGPAHVGQGHSYEVNSDSDRTVLTLSIWQTGTTDAVVTPADTVYLRLESGTVLEVHVDADVAPQGQVWASQYSAGVTTSWMLKFTLKGDTLEKLRTERVDFVRVTIPGGTDVEYWTAVGKANRLRKVLACVTES